MIRYLEGYCRIPVAPLHRAYDRGQGSLVWRDQTGALVGSAMVTNRFDEIMRVAFGIAGSDEVEAYMGEVAISLRWQPAGLHRLEPYAACPGCEASVKVLIAKDCRWRCRTCHGLVNRSARIRTNIRLTEQVERLEALVGPGRPMGMHNATYERERQRLKDAKIKLGSSALSADRRYTHIVEHHMTGETVRAKRKSASSRVDIFGDRLFALSMFERINALFTERAYKTLKKVTSRSTHSSAHEVESAIIRAVRLRPLVLGMPNEVSDSAEKGGLAVTVVEVPFVGDAGWLGVGSERGEPLPPIFGQIDEEASLVRFQWNNSVIDRPALRVQIDETLRVLREQLARQQASLDLYHASLHAEVRRYLQYQNDKRS